MPPDQDPWDRTRLVHQGPSVPKVVHRRSPKSSPTARYCRSLTLYLSIQRSRRCCSGSPLLLSQWSLPSFVVDDVSYSCAEQFILAEKARLIQDLRAEELLMSSPDPCVNKRNDRGLRSFDNAIWDRVRVTNVHRTRP